jgi:UrcA family protein
MIVMLKSKALISLGLCAGALIFSSPVLAQERTVQVTVSDLNLASPSGQMQLQKRVARAARSVCRDGDMRSARENAEARKCEAQAKAGAEPRIAERIAQYKAQRGLAARANLKLASD